MTEHRVAPALSVAVISHGHEALLRRCLDSFDAALDGIAAEWLVLDNLGGDLRPFAAGLGHPCMVLHNDRPCGFAANVNRLARLGTGRLLLLLNPDTHYVSGRIGEGLEFFERNDRIGVLGCRLLNSDGSLQASYRRFPTLPQLGMRALGADRWRRRPGYYDRQMMYGKTFSGPTRVEWFYGAFMLLRRQQFLDIGGMDEDFHVYYEDVDLCYRLTEGGMFACYYPALTVCHEHRRSSAAQPLARIWRWHVQSAARYFFKHGYCWRAPLSVGSGPTHESFEA